ncbi:hypothetical protein BY458DRAFT_498862, partial [Sporodiniella umbellata]
MQIHPNTDHFLSDKPHFTQRHVHTTHHASPTVMTRRLDGHQAFSSVSIGIPEIKRAKKK